MVLICFPTLEPIKVIILKKLFVGDAMWPKIYYRPPRPVAPEYVQFSSAPDGGLRK